MSNFRFSKERRAQNELNKSIKTTYKRIKYQTLVSLMSILISPSNHPATAVADAAIFIQSLIVGKDLYKKGFYKQTLKVLNNHNKRNK